MELEIFLPTIRLIEIFVENIVSFDTVCWATVNKKAIERLEKKRFKKSMTDEMIMVRAVFVSSSLLALFR